MGYFHILLTQNIGTFQSNFSSSTISQIEGSDDLFSMDLPQNILFQVHIKGSSHEITILYIRRYFDSKYYFFSSF